MKKYLALALAGIMTCALVTGCGSSKTGASTNASGSSSAASSSGSGAKTSEKPFEGTEINVLCEGHASSDAYEKLVGEFEDETGIKVNLEIIPYSELPQKVALSFSQKSTDYDMVMNDRIYMQGYVDNGYIACLDDMIKDNSINQYYDASDFVPAYGDAVKIDGKTYGFPVYGESTFLMYRKDLFEKYGIAVPKTMDELIAAAKTVKEKSNGQIAGITLRGQKGVHVCYTWGAFLWAYGGRYFDENGKLVLDSPEAIKATQAYVDLLNNYGPEGFTNFGWQENRLLFQQGKAAMTIDATVNGAYCEDSKESDIVGKVGYAPVPTESEHPYGGPSSLAVHGFYINNAIDETQKKAAFLFGSWATSAKVQEETIAVEPHCGLTSQKAIASDAFQTKYGAFANDMVTALKGANPDYMPTVSQADEIIDKVGTALSECLVGSKTPQSALTEVTKDINTNVLKK